MKQASSLAVPSARPHGWTQAPHAPLSVFPGAGAAVLTLQPSTRHPGQEVGALLSARRGGVVVVLLGLVGWGWGVLAREWCCAADALPYPVNSSVKMFCSSTGVSDAFPCPGSAHSSTVEPSLTARHSNMDMTVGHTTDPHPLLCLKESVYRCSTTVCRGQKLRLRLKQARLIKHTEEASLFTYL